MKLDGFYKKIVPAILALVVILAYAWQITEKGYYWDDWAFAFLAHSYGPSELISAFSAFRPFLGPIFWGSLSLLGLNPVVWQIAGLVIRLVLGLACWWMLNQIWPKRDQQNLMVTLLFLVFPGFSQQWVALTHINQELISLVAYLFSIGLSVSAIKSDHRRPLKLAAAILLGVVGLFTTEYFFGYEFIRLAIFFVILDERKIADRLKKVIAAWWPYLLVWVADLLWLLRYYRSDSYHSYGISVIEEISTDAWKFFASALVNTLEAFGTTVVQAWTKAPNVFTQSYENPGIRIVLVVFALVLIGLSLLRIRFGSSGKLDDDQEGWGIQAIVIGLIAMFVGRLPSWAADLPLMVSFDYDRFFISIMLGASLFLIGLLEFFLKPGQRRIWIGSAMIAFALCAQILYGFSYQQDWKDQKEFFQQLAWRAPGIEPGTILLTDNNDSIEYVSDMGLTAGLNWMYVPELDSHDLPYLVVYSDIRKGKAALPEIAEDQPINVEYRTAAFSGNTSRAIVFYQPVIGCLRLIDPNDPLDLRMSDLSKEMLAIAPLSDLSLIDSDAQSPDLPAEVFGSMSTEPGWCYYYQKAELANQTGDWETAARMGDEARAAGVGLEDSIELLPMIAGYVHGGNIDRAGELLEAINTKNVRNNSTVCSFLKSMARNTSDTSAHSWVQNNFVRLGCETP